MNISLTAEEQQLADLAIAKMKGKENQGIFVKSYFGSLEMISETVPISIFMAGSPGAGKSEIVGGIVGNFKQKPLVIDADRIRTIFQGYNGENSYIFQQAAVIGVNTLFYFAVKHSLNFILDATFAYEKATQNVEQCLLKNRTVIIDYIFQDPVVAWNVTKAREQKEGRHVPREVFIDTFCQSRENVNAVKERFGNKIELNLFVRNADSNQSRQKLNIQTLDPHLPRVYSKDELDSIIPHV